MTTIKNQVNINGLDIRLYLSIYSGIKFNDDDDNFHFQVEFVVEGAPNYNNFTIIRYMKNSGYVRYICNNVDILGFTSCLPLFGYNEDISYYIHPIRTVNQNYFDINILKLPIIKELFYYLIKQNYKELIYSFIEAQIKQTVLSCQLNCEYDFNNHEIYNKYSEILNNLVIECIL